MIVSTVAQFCSVEYEPDLGGSSRCDLLIRPSGPSTAGCLVEITTISDDHAHKRNPYDKICRAIRQKLVKLGCPDRSYSIDVQGDKVGDYGNAHMQLHLGSGRAEDLYDRDFYEFARAIARDPHAPRSHHWKGPNLDIKLTFSPGEQFHYGHHLSYTTPYSRKKNPLYRALEDKRKQLAKSGHAGPCGVIVCDGGCDLLTQHSGPAGGEASLRSIIEDQFRSSDRISFVLVLYADIPIPNQMTLLRQERSIGMKQFLRTNASDDALCTLEILSSLPRLLPRPVMTGSNAANCYQSRWEDRPNHGRHSRMTQSERKITLSARAVLDMLAGDEHPADYFSGFSNSGPFTGNRFKSQKDKGRLIKSIQLIPGENDDDLIEIQFGDQDPAISEFRIPASRSPE